MNKFVFLLIFIVLGNIDEAQCGVDTLDYFNLNKSNYSYNVDQNGKDEWEKREIEYNDFLKAKVKKYYRFWNGNNESISSKITDMQFTAKKDLSFFATDYFEICLAKKYIDPVYLDSMINNGRVLFAQYQIENEKNRRNDSLGILKRIQEIIPSDDFYLMYAFAQKLNREICFIRIAGEENKFYIVIYDNLKTNDYAKEVYRKLDFTEIPTNYVIQDKFDQF